MSRRVLIVGASRGIGLGLVDRHLEDGWRVHATIRGETAPRVHPSLVTHRLDVRDVDRLGEMVEELNEPLDRIIHNAGIKGGPRRLVMEVNAEAPIRVVQTLLDADRLRPGGVVAIMTSQVGARRGRSGGLGDYGDSKAALNDEFRRRAADWRRAGALAVVIHPGWVRTDMGGGGAPLAIEESAAAITELLDGLDPSLHGRFLTWDGREHPW